MAFFRQIDVHLVNEASKAKARGRHPTTTATLTDRDEALNQLTAAFAVCLEAGLTDIPGLVKQIIDGAEPEPTVKPH
jgi:hypothetical protein